MHSLGWYLYNEVDIPIYTATFHGLIRSVTNISGSTLLYLEPFAWHCFCVSRRVVEKSQCPRLPLSRTPTPVSLPGRRRKPVPYPGRRGGVVCDTFLCTHCSAFTPVGLEQFLTLRYAWVALKGPPVTCPTHRDWKTVGLHWSCIQWWRIIIRKPLNSRRK